ncbi:uncharacterized protein [Palaemon carinicauda]|uniref:uncharacterized protein n=1 Tax=Palaemon carinicauda TaxID=392227 RepID=UPI0035B5911B
MDNLLGSIEGVGIYLDDDVIYFPILEKVFEKLRGAYLTINLERSEFRKATVRYFGFEVGRGQITPVAANVKGIRKASTPNEEAIAMLFRDGRIPPTILPNNFSFVVAPLTDLTSPPKQFVWTSKCQESFDRIKPY